MSLTQTKTCDWVRKTHTSASSSSWDTKAQVFSSPIYPRSSPITFALDPSLDSFSSLFSTHKSCIRSSLDTARPQLSLTATSRSSFTYLYCRSNLFSAGPYPVKSYLLSKFNKTIFPTNRYSSHSFWALLIIGLQWLANTPPLSRWPKISWTTTSVTKTSFLKH